MMKWSFSLEFFIVNHCSLTFCFAFLIIGTWQPLKDAIWREVFWLKCFNLSKSLQDFIFSLSYWVSSFDLEYPVSKEVCDQNWKPTSKNVFHILNRDSWWSLFQRLWWTLKNCTFLTHFTGLFILQIFANSFANRSDVFSQTFQDFPSS